MKRMIIIAICMLAVINVYGWVVENGSLEEFVYGRNDSLVYDNWLSHVVEGIADEGYNLYAPYDRQTTGFGNYTEPTEEQLTDWREITTAVTEWDYELADTLLVDTGLPFELVEYNDTETGNTYWMIREQLNLIYVDDNGTPDWSGDDERGSFDYGWGLFIFNPLAAYPVIVTTPHITDDYPTVPAGLKLFRDSNAYAMLISGVGREVYWDDSNNYYSNSFSICDPSRQEDTIFNSVYQPCCDYLRSAYDHRELSIQVHSYDWNRHQWYANCQISAGWGKNDPGVPIRDYSEYGWDIINQGREWMLETNEVGIHPAVHLNDYYGVNCSTYPYNFSNEDTTFAVNTSIDLPGYRYNRQMVYTDAGWNDHLTYEPFFHIEMDELPNCYPQTEANYYWFWGYDPITQRFDYDHIFDHALEYYSYWIEDLAAVIPALFENDDEALPTATTPLEIVSANFNRVELSWEKTNSYDYETYELLYSEEPIANGNYEIWDRGNDSDLNNAAATTTLITGLESNTEYFFQMRVLDANGNYSELSNEVSCLTGPTRLRYEKAVGSDSLVTFSFNALYQEGNNGFMIYRRAENEMQYSLVDSWETNPILVALNGIDNFTYTWEDSLVENWVEYSYIAASSDTVGNEYWHNYPQTVTPFDIYQIHFMHEDSLLTDDIWFGASPNASSGFDNDYDLDQDEEPGDDYVFAEFYEEDWNNHQSMIKQIEGGYDFDESVKSWVFRVKSDQYGDFISVDLKGEFWRDGRKLYLIDELSGQVLDMQAGVYEYENTSGGWRYFTLYWGNLLPSVSFASPANHIYQAGETTSFSWNIGNNFLIENFDVYIVSDTDEIQIAHNLPAFFNQVNWTVPEGLVLEDAHIKLDLLMIDGDRRQYRSGFKFGSVGSEFALAVPAGYHLISNPFLGESDINEMLGGGTNIYKLSEGEYEQDMSFFYGEGYFAESILGHVTMIEADIQGGNEQFGLSAGWNIVSNPHLAGCWRDDIRIITPNLEMTYAEAVQYELVASAVYKYDQGWHEVDYIYPTESFLMYCHEDSMQVKFIPYNENHNWLIKEAAEYRVRITADQGNGILDEMILKLNPVATEGHDKLYDLPEPYITPGLEDLRLYAVLDSAGTVRKYNQLSCGVYNIFEVAQEWQFALEAEQLQPVVISLAESDLPEEVVVIVNYNGVEHDLTREGDLVIEPEDNIVEGLISFVPVWMGDDNDSVPAAVSIMSYPNPFYSGAMRSEGINIAYSLRQAGKVNLSIYNIKGQKVIELLSDWQDAGTHKIAWNLQNERNQEISAGIYFTRLKVGKEEKYSKIVIIK